MSIWQWKAGHILSHNVSKYLSKALILFTTRSSSCSSITASSFCTTSSQDFFFFFCCYNTRKSILRLPPLLTEVLKSFLSFFLSVIIQSFFYQYEQRFYGGKNAPRTSLFFGRIFFHAFFAGKKNANDKRKQACKM